MQLKFYLQINKNLNIIRAIQVTARKKYDADDDAGRHFVILFDDVLEAVQSCDLANERMVPEGAKGEGTAKDSHRTKLASSRRVKPYNTRCLDVVIKDKNEQRHQKDWKRNRRP